MNGTGWRWITLGFHKERLPAVSRGVQVILKAVTTSLHNAFELMGEGFAPLVGVTRVTLGMLKSSVPDVGGDHGGITRRANPQHPVSEQIPARDQLINAAFVCLPDGLWCLEPVDVTGLQQAMAAIAAV